MLRNLIMSEHETIKNDKKDLYEIEELSMEDEENKEEIELIKLPEFHEKNPNICIDKNIKNTSPDKKFEDNNSVLVIILQCETRKCDKNIEQLKYLFSDPYFVVHVCYVEPTEDKENYDIKKIFNFSDNGPFLLNDKGEFESQKWWCDLPTLIIKDSSVSHLSHDKSIRTVKHKIKSALEKAKDADLYYLCKWNDSCEKHKDVKDCNDKTLKWSVKPTSTQAIMYTKKSKSYILEQSEKSNGSLGQLLNSHINKGNLLATVFTPNIIDYDADLAISNSDYSKLNECDMSNKTNTNNNNSTQILLIVILIILIAVVAWFIIRRPVIKI